ncbi:hypothetical protein E2P86_08020 [Sphingobacterium psychroaquaticum]|nr:hypothetical protein E2P86_08020 [Sphingobacterium psychroaquaticum]
MRKFSDFNIVIESKGFVGDKIKISKILNRIITVHSHKLEDSKHFKNDCLHLQIELNGQMYVCFSGSKTLIEQIKQVPQSSFPFETTIESDNDRYIFR